jgi:hypothetical protein
MASSVLAAPALASPVLTAETAEDPAASVTVSVQSGIARPGEGLTVSGAVVNRGTTALPEGSLTLSISEDTLDRGELQAGLAAPGGEDAPDTVEIGTVPVPAVPVASSTQVFFGLGGPELDAVLGGSGWGAHLLVARLQVGAVVADASSGFVWAEGDGPAPVGLVTVIPLTTPPGDAGLLDADELAAYTAPDGNLTRKLDAGLGTASPFALDPRILASIRALGVNAPESTLAWLRRLDAAENTVFPLQYADAEPALQRRSGAPALLTPISFESSLDPANFPDGVPELGGAGANPDTAADGSAASPTATSPAGPPTPTPTPSPTGAPTGVPTSEQLLEWDYSFTDLIWPSSVAAGDAAYWAASGYTRSLVPSAALQSPAVPPATGTVDGGSAVVLDSVLSRAMSAAAFATGEAEGRRALADATALLAATASAATGPVVVALDRSVPASTENLSAALGSIRSLPWVAAQAFDALQASGPELAVAAEAAPDPRAALVGELLGADRAIADFATILERPELLTGRERLRLLALLSAQWAALPDAWSTAAVSLRTQFGEVLRSVSITSTSGFAFGAFDEIPFFVENSLDFPVTVTFTGRPSNGRLLVDRVTATIEAQSSSRVEMPAETIANGRVALQVRALSPVTGLPIGDPAVLEFDVQAEWETVGLVVMGALVAGLFGFGLYRSIRRSRRERTAA